MICRHYCYIYICRYCGCRLAPVNIICLRFVKRDLTRPGQTYLKQVHRTRVDRRYRSVTRRGEETEKKVHIFFIQDCGRIWIDSRNSYVPTLSLQTMLPLHGDTWGYLYTRSRLDTVSTNDIPSIERIYLRSNVLDHFEMGTFSDTGNYFLTKPDRSTFATGNHEYNHE